MVCFANTGAELEATLAFVRTSCEFYRWKVPIVWLEYRYHPEARGRRKDEWRHRHKVVDYM